MRHYKCRTCSSEYHAAQELCEDCYNRESQRHLGHDFARMAIRRVTDMPDDLEAQLQNSWRCAFPGCGFGKYWRHGLILHYECTIRRRGTTLTSTVTGPQVDWQHKHPEGVLCVGDAVIEFCRKMAPSNCTKTAIMRMRLKDPPNATPIKCNICMKGLWLLQF